MIFRVGFSKDTHNLIAGESLILGGIKVTSPKKVDSYSDGDVVFHSLAEALFGSLGLDDLGSYYNSKNMPKNFDSSIMINDALKRLTNNNFSISNIDILIELDSPNLSEWKVGIKESISKILNIEKEKISIKATTTEGNFLNMISAYCNVAIFKEEGEKNE